MPPTRNSSTRRPRAAPLLDQYGRPKTTGHNSSRPWHGFDLLLTKYRLKDLNREEMIDWQAGSMPPIDFTSLDDHGDVHPILRRENWLGITDQDYLLLLPVLRVATRFLEEPSMMPWWSGLFSSPYSPLSDPLTRRRHGLHLKQFDIRPFDPNNPQSLRETNATKDQLTTMKDFVKWSFSNLPSGSAGKCGAMLGPGTDGAHVDGFVPGNTYASSITLSDEYLEVLRGNIDIRNFPKAAAFGREEAKVRTMFDLMTTILHELCHAVVYASHYAVPAVLQGHEPFFRDYRICEVGSSFQRLIFGGLIWPLGRNTVAKGISFSFPYGAKHVNWPGTSARGTTNGEVLRGTPALWGETRDYNYAVPISHFHRMFTHRFWAQELPLHGIDTSFKPDLWLGAVSEPPQAQQLGDYEAGLVARDPVDSEFLMTGDEELRRWGFKLKDTSNGANEADSPDTELGWNAQGI